MITEIGKFLLISGLIYLGITAVLIITNRPTTEVMDGPLDFETLMAVSINIDINFQRGDVQLRQSN